MQRRTMVNLSEKKRKMEIAAAVQLLLHGETDIWPEHRENRPYSSSSLYVRLRSRGILLKATPTDVATGPYRREYYTLDRSEINSLWTLKTTDVQFVTRELLSRASIKEKERAVEEESTRENNF